MNDDDVLAARFEAVRPRLRAIAYQLLGSLEDADDAVQTAWLRSSRADLGDVREMTAWFTTVTVRQCLDQLRARRRRGEVLLADDQAMSVFAPAAGAADEELLLAESVGRALLVVLGRLSPAQRAAFVLHDLFAVPFDELGRMLDRSPAAAKKLASRARDRLHGRPPEDQRLTAEHFKIASAFLSASQGGDIPALLELLAPGVVRKADRVLIPDHAATEVRGAREVAEETRVFAAWARVGEVAMVDGVPGIVMAPAGRLHAVIRLTIRVGRITAIDVIGDPRRLAAATLTLPADLNLRRFRRLDMPHPRGPGPVGVTPTGLESGQCRTHRGISIPGLMRTRPAGTMTVPSPRMPGPKRISPAGLCLVARIGCIVGDVHGTGVAQPPSLP